MRRAPKTPEAILIHVDSLPKHVRVAINKARAESKTSFAHMIRVALHEWSNTQVQLRKIGGVR